MSAPGSNGVALRQARGFFTKSTIGRRLIWWFLIISIVPCATLAVYTYKLSEDSLAATLRRNLQVIADSKAGEIEKLALERTRSVTALSRTLTLVNACARLDAAFRKEGVSSKDFQTVEADVSPILSSVAEAFGYANFFLLAPDGTVLYAMAPGLEVGSNLATGSLRNSELAGVFDRAKTLLQAEISDFSVYPGAKDPAAFIGGPVLQQTAVVGVMIFQLNNRQIYQVFRDYAGLGKTGEVLVSARVGNEAVMVAPTRHDENAAFHSRVAFGSEDGRATQLAVQGDHGYGPNLDYRGVETLAAWTYLPSFRWGLVVKQDRSEALELIDQQRRATLILLGLILIPVAIVARLVARSISRPIRFAADAAQQVALGDLTTPLTICSRDETGQLLDAFRAMIAGLKKLLGQIQGSSDQLVSTAGEIADASRTQETTVMAFGSSTAEIVATVKQISTTSRELVGTMNRVQQTAVATGELADTGRESLVEVEQSMRTLGDGTQSISAKLAEIQDKAQSINGVITTMTKVADQTNLLSLNATIEASKAGEFGKGFSVVAAEIRRLAEQTAVATLDIESTVRQMQSSVSTGVREMDQFTHEVGKTVARVGEISRQMGQIIEQSQGLGPQFSTVSEGVEAQAQGAQQINESMTQLSEVAQKTSESLGHFNQATEQLRQLANALETEVSKFKV